MSMMTSAVVLGEHKIGFVDVDIVKAEPGLGAGKSGGGGLVRSKDESATS